MPRQSPGPSRRGLGPPSTGPGLGLPARRHDRYRGSWHNLSRVAAKSWLWPASSFLWKPRSRNWRLSAAFLPPLRPDRSPTPTARPATGSSASGVTGADGVATKAGGKVVKNVTGYDLNKLYTGSLGTLGIVVEATFKVSPLQLESTALTACFPTLDSAVAAGTALLDSPAAPIGLRRHFARRGWA